jgi:hypothetical protein
MEAGRGNDYIDLMLNAVAIDDAGFCDASGAGVAERDVVAFQGREV